MFLNSFNTASGKYYCNAKKLKLSLYATYGVVSIPQAVSTIAIEDGVKLAYGVQSSFNTASGKYYCNSQKKRALKAQGRVSIPQAVSTIAIVKQNTSFTMSISSFNTASGKYYCNWQILVNI